LFQRRNRAAQLHLVVRGVRRAAPELGHQLVWHDHNSAPSAWTGIALGGTVGEYDRAIHVASDYPKCERTALRSAADCRSIRGEAGWRPTVRVKGRTHQRSISQSDNPDFQPVRRGRRATTEGRVYVDDEASRPPLTRIPAKTGQGTAGRPAAHAA